MKKIIYYSPHPNLNLGASTGYGIHMREMITAMRDNGHEVVTLIAGGEVMSDLKSTRPVAKSKLKKIMPPLLWETLKDLMLFRHDKRMQERLIQLVNKEKPDAIYERIAYGQNSGVKVAKQFGIKHISEINAPYPEERVYFSGDSMLLKKAHRIEEEVLLKTNAVFTVSGVLKEHLLKKTGINSNKIYVVPNAINPRGIITDARQIETLRQEYDLTNHIVFGFVGSIFPYHGVDLMVKAFAQLENAERYKLLIVGDGETIDELKKITQSLKVDSNVIFTGGINYKEVFNHISLMDICMMAKSNWYGSPVKIFEYGAMGKALIVPDVDPVRDVMDDSDGVLVKPAVAEIKNAMQMLGSNEELRKKLGENWGKKVFSKHTWNNVANLLDDIL